MMRQKEEEMEAIVSRLLLKIWLEEFQHLKEVSFCVRAQNIHEEKEGMDIMIFTGVLVGKRTVASWKYFTTTYEADYLLDIERRIRSFYKSVDLETVAKMEQFEVEEAVKNLTI